MKAFLKRIIVSVLGWQVRRLRKRHDIKVVGVAGSIGKTSTKFAIAKVLAANKRVRFQEGNYNDIVTVPLIFFGLQAPALLNPFAWLVAILKIELQLHKPYPFDVVVVELSTDGPGQIAAFQRYITLDIGVITAIVPEHMEFFKDLDAVAHEEIAIAKYSQTLLINTDLCAKMYVAQLQNSKSYGLHGKPDYGLDDVKFGQDGYHFTVNYQGKLLLESSHPAIAESQLYSICAAAAVGNELGMSKASIINGIAEIRPVNGRMRQLNGLNGSIVLDDTYNASPDAVKAALNTLYQLKAPQKIAVLGNMNELGAYSESAHKEIGEYCDPKQLEQVISIGPQANQYLAAAAEKRGCSVERFDSPFAAGEYLKERIKPGTVILVKGSQNGVFAEETVKLLLAHPSDASKLVRQSQDWLKIKARQFKT